MNILKVINNKISSRARTSTSTASKIIILAL